MAVEAKRIKERLKVIFPGVNLSKKRMDEISARLAKKPEDDADDTAVDQVINDANDFMPFEDIAKEDDRVRNLEKKANEKQDPNPKDGKKKENDDEPETPKTDDAPEWAKSMIEQNRKLSEQVQELKTGKIIESKTNSARKSFEENETFKSLKDSQKDFFFKQINVDSETPIDEQIEELETHYKDLVQQSADSNSYAGAPPSGGSSNEKPSEKEIDSIVDDL